MSGADNGFSATTRLYQIDLDPKSLANNNPNVQHEREVAIFDLLKASIVGSIGR